jgi:hypothetical protein
MARAETYEEALQRDEERFWSKVDKSPHPMGCWLWTAGRTTHGRGSYSPSRFKGVAIREGRGFMQAHVYAFILTFGSRPLGHGSGRGASGIILAHTCDNGHNGCVNPHHLQATTQGKNQQDKMRAGTHERITHKKDKILIKAMKRKLGVDERCSLKEIQEELQIADADILRTGIDALTNWIKNTHGQEVSIDWNTMGIKIHKRKAASVPR